MDNARKLLSLFVRYTQDIYSDEIDKRLARICTKNEYYSEALTSGIVCAYLLLSLDPENVCELVIARVLDYVLLYLYVDMYLDNPTTDEKEKSEFVIWLLDERRTAITPFQEEVLALYDNLVME